MLYNYHDRQEAFAPMTELVYVLVLEAKFCEFESRLGHQMFLCAFSKMDITVGYEPTSGSSILSGRTKLWKCGRVRFMALVLKTSEQKCSVSSNLTASANV